MTVAGSGEAALQQVRTQTFDLLISDLAMPGMDGYTLLTRVRETGATMPAVAVSGMGRLSDRKRALDAGFADLIGKPVELLALMTVIERLLAR